MYLYLGLLSKDEPLVYFVENEYEKREQIQNIIDRVREGENS